MTRPASWVGRALRAAALIIAALIGVALLLLVLLLEVWACAAVLSRIAALA